jgi:hypothetical protein
VAVQGYRRSARLNKEVLRSTQDTKGARRMSDCFDKFFSQIVPPFVRTVASIAQKYELAMNIYRRQIKKYSKCKKMEKIHCNLAGNRV